MKILCVCENGNVRSVGTKWRLNRRNRNDTIAIGVRRTSDETRKMLCDWADMILLAEPWMAEFIQAKEKIANFTIGPDVYGKYGHPDLQHLIKEQLNKLGLR